MKSYIATFYTHFSALLTYRSLQDKGIAARMAPVPRKLSASCGTCVLYEAEDICRDCLDEDAEAVYSETFERIWENQ